MSELRPSLPSFPPYVPGSGTAPDHGFFEAVKAATPRRVDEGNWSRTPAYGYGFDLYAAGYFWEAHEVWEPVWMACAPNSRERDLVRSLIQIANACLKVAMGRPGAAMKLVALAREHLPAAPPDQAMGMGLSSVANDLVSFERALKAAGGQVDTALLDRRPRLRLV